MEEKDDEATSVVLAPSRTEMLHYGGSERTVDGAGKGKTKSASASASTEIIKVPIITSTNHMSYDPSSIVTVAKSKRNIPNENQGDDHDNSSGPQDEPIRHDDNDDDDSGSDLDEFKISVATDSLVKRSTPGRRASTKKTKYA
jgi:hypothetical protein